MKILHTEASQGWGGQDIRVFRECAEMERRGHTVVLACAPGSPLWDAAKERGVTLEPLVFGRKLKLRDVRAVMRLIKKHKPDIVNTHSSGDGWSGAVAAKLARVPHVRSRHLANPLRHNRANLYLYKNLTDAVLTVGEPLRQRLIDENGLDGSRIVSAPTGVDLEKLDAALYDATAFRKELHIPDDHFLWVVVAILRRAKGMEFLIEAMNSVLKTHPNAHLAVVGGTTGPSPLPDQLKNRSQELGMTSRVHFTGMRDDVPQILLSADGFVLPTLADGVSQSVTQAMVMGLPVVSTDVGGLTEVVRDGETGWAVPARDAQALAAAMRRVMDMTPDERKAMGQRGQAIVRAGYSFEATVNHVEKLYAKVLENRRA